MDKFKVCEKSGLIEKLILVLAIISLLLSFSFINDRSIGGILNDFFKTKINITLVSFLISTITFGLSYRLNQNNHIVKVTKIISLICIIAILLSTATTILFGN